MTDPIISGQTWVAFSAVGAVGSIHRVTDGFTFKLLSDDGYRGVFATLDAAKAALHANLLPGTPWPEFHEH
ncbi:MAG: methyltransferase [Rhodoglobus sp.]